MLIEGLFSICLMMLVMCLLGGFMVSFVSDYCGMIDELDQRTTVNQLRMLIESDLFVRRRSEISVATNGKERFCIGFWEQSDGEKKYLIYDFHAQPDSNNLIRLYRSCFNQEDLQSSETGPYCHMMIAKITSGEYRTQTQFKYMEDYSQFCQGHFENDNGIIRVQLGDYRYAF